MTGKKPYNHGQTKETALTQCHWFTVWRGPEKVGLSPMAEGFP